MVCAGIDVSKGSLSCCVGEEVREFANTPQGLAGLAEFASGAGLWCMEATGRYHALAADLAWSLGVRCVVVNPGKARKYLGFVSSRGKTDALDARALSRLGEAEGDRLRAYSPAPGWVLRLRDDLVRRRALVEARVALEQVAGEAGDPEGRLREAARGLRASQRALEAELARRLSDQPRYQDLRSIPGVGPLGAALLLCALERGEFATSDALVAFAGLDPKPRDSGRRKGRRALSRQGDAQLRTALFMAARAGSRMAQWRPYYLRQIGKGLSTTEATVILERKLVRVAWSVFRQKGPFVPQPDGATLDSAT